MNTVFLDPIQFPCQCTRGTSQHFPIHLPFSRETDKKDAKITDEDNTRYNPRRNKQLKDRTCFTSLMAPPSQDDSDDTLNSPLPAGPSRLGDSLRAQTEHTGHGLSLCSSLTRSRSALDRARFFHQCRLEFSGSSTCSCSGVFRRRVASRGRGCSGRAPQVI